MRFGHSLSSLFAQMRNQPLLASLLIATALVGCAAPKPLEATVIRQIDLPGGYEYAGAVWLDSDRILALRRPTNATPVVGGQDEMVWISVADSDTVERFATSPTTWCPLTSLTYPRRVDASRITVIRSCPTSNPSVGIDIVSLIDTQTGLVTDLTEWVPVNHLISMALTPQTIYPMIVISTGGTVHWVADDHTVNSLDNGIDLGYEGINSAAWSPDGKKIAYAGVFHPFQISPSDADIVLAQADFSQPVVLLSQVQLPFNLQWSHSGRWLAFRGQVRGAAGVWAIEVESKALYRVWNEAVEFAWKPNSDSELVVIRPGRGSERQGDSAVVFLSLAGPTDPATRAPSP